MVNCTQVLFNNSLCSDSAFVLEHKKPKPKPPRKKPQTNHKNSTGFQPCSSLLLGKNKKGASLKIRKLVKLKEAVKKIKMLTVALVTVYKIKMRCSEEVHTTIKRF